MLELGMGEFRVVRYKGTKNIVEMMERGEYVEAFIHAQLGVEKILWDKIVARALQKKYVAQYGC